MWQSRTTFISSLQEANWWSKFSVISAQCVIVPGTHMPVPGIPFYFQTTTHAGDEQSTITIEEDCWIASGCTLLMKSHIGRGPSWPPAAW